ncbi:ferrochelatase [Paraperlucidibaca baekdonensis]|uniref:Ferrochelatase n=1 Tax=Paraperlucidibaca baekdonensis TaxID=748120 RepID=A0A3E0H4U2_9GAMM|nr:ferrochelatase [Paraperlucidibaca baekdonensis]REH37913.1 ferrochelatase [Paraperlucidibaca baekdonensis]
MTCVNESCYCREKSPAAPTERTKVAIFLANLGTPTAPTAAAVRTYLREFLSDTRVIEVPRLIWFFILRLFILPLRPKRVAKAYASIWTNESPMRETLLAQVAAVQARVSASHPQLDITVLPAMSYGEPSMRDAMAQCHAQGIDQWLVLPLFPQYSATSTAPLYDQIARWIPQQRRLPSLQIIRDYHAHPRYIRALAESIKAHWAAHGQAEKLLFSFHGIPQPYADKGDPYPEHCRATAAAVVRELGLHDEQWCVSFQSRFGLQEWVKPYTDATLEAWGKLKLASVDVVCPAFSADCLETLEEIAEENREIFQHAGGGRYAYIGALNDHALHIDMMDALLSPRLSAIASEQAHGTLTHIGEQTSAQAALLSSQAP